MSTLDDAAPVLQELVEETAAEHHCPSISWGIVVNGELALHGSTGTNAGTPPTPDSVYRIASMTKSFTCAAILTLRDEGVLSLDDPIAEHAPELGVVAAPTSDSGPIRIRHLMTMSSGLATDDAWADRHLDIGDDELDAALRGGQLFAVAPGEAWEYSNLGFGLLGRVVHRATGRRVQEIVSERLLRPLGLDRTTWVEPAHDDWARPHRAVDGEIAHDGMDPLGDGGIAPMGGIWSTVRDLARWVSWLDDATPARDGTDDGPLSRASRREMQHMHRYARMADLAGVTAPTGYGYGLLVRDDPHLGRVVAHSGGLPGYGSNMRWIAGRRVGAIALANVTYAPMAMLTQRMLMTLHGRDALPAAPALAAPLVEQAARDLVALLADWDDDRATALFADNVALDDPLTRRRAAAARLLDACGGSLEIVTIRPEHATGATVELVHPSGRPATVTLALCPIAPPRVQEYDVVLPPEHLGHDDLS